MTNKTLKKINDQKEITFIINNHDNYDILKKTFENLYLIYYKSLKKSTYNTIKISSDNIINMKNKLFLNNNYKCYLLFVNFIQAFHNYTNIKYILACLIPEDIQNIDINNVNVEYFKNILYGIRDIILKQKSYE